MAVFKKILDVFPTLYETELGDRKLYDSLNLSNGIEIHHKDIEKIAMDHASEQIVDAAQHMDAVEDCVNNFKSGVYWYISNKDKVDSLSDDDWLEVISFAAADYSKLICQNIEVDTDEYGFKDAIRFIDVTESDFSDGILWAKANYSKLNM